LLSGIQGFLTVLSVVRLLEAFILEILWLSLTFFFSITSLRRLPPLEMMNGGEEFKNVVRLQQVRALSRVSERLTISGFKSDGEQLMGLPWAGYVFEALPDFLRRTFFPGEARPPSATLPNGHYHSATLHQIVIISRISDTAGSLLCYNKEKQVLRFSE
jgi:hypothetical protein